MPDLVGPGHGVQGTLRVFVGVQRTLVVLAHRVVECMPGDIGVEVLQFFTELGDVLLGSHLRRGQLCGQLLRLLAFDRAVAGTQTEGAEDHDGDHKEEKHQFHGLKFASGIQGRWPWSLWRRCDVGARLRSVRG